MSAKSDNTVTTRTDSIFLEFSVVTKNWHRRRNFTDFKLNTLDSAKISFHEVATWPPPVPVH